MPLHVTFDSNVYWGVRARLKRGVTPRMAEQRLQPLFDEFAKETPGRFPRGARPLVWRLVESERSADYVPTLLLIFASSMLLLLLACANVSILLLVRGTSRAHEFVVRAAIGASRGRLMRQLLVESLLLASSGAALGVATSYWGLPTVLRLLPPNTVPVGDLLAVPVNVPVLLFSAGLATASALICGLSPALSLSRPRLIATTRTTAGVESRRAHHLLLAGQIALTVLLLAGTGATVRGLIGLYRTSLGYDPHNVIIARSTFQRTATRTGPAAPPSMSACGIAWQTCPKSNRSRSPPLQRDTTLVGRSGGGRSSGTGHDRRRGADCPADQWPLLCDDENPPRSGRVWSDSEGAGTPHVAVINQAMARERWPDESPIGRRVRIPDYIKSPTPFWRAAPGSDGWFEIIGVVGDTPNVGLHEPPAPSIYVPYTLMLGDSAECDPADESRPTFDDPIDSGGGADGRSPSASEGATHGGRVAGRRGLGP